MHNNKTTKYAEFAVKGREWTLTIRITLEVLKRLHLEVAETIKKRDEPSKSDTFCTNQKSSGD